MSYAVRGPLAIRAVELEKEIKSVAASLLFMIIRYYPISIISNIIQLLSINQFYYIIRAVELEKEIKAVAASLFL